jgi:RNA polymerase-binding transcription factor
MAKNENIAKELKTRLSELTGRLAEIDSELRKPLSADSEERATDLENQDALEGIKSSEIQEVHQIQGALSASPKVLTGSACNAVQTLTPNA